MAADYDTLVYNEVGGAKLVVADGGTIEIQSGGTLDVLSGANVDLGTFSYSMEVTQADNYPLGVFGRISTAQTTGSTTQRAIWARMDVDANLSGTSSVMGAELQFRFDGATSIGSGVEAEQYTGAWLYFEQDTANDTLADFCHASAGFASVETTSDLNLSANTHLSGIEIASRLGAADGTAWADSTGTTAGLFITKAPAAAGVTASDWPYGIFVENVTTAINIAACTTGIALAGAMTDGIIISGTMSSNGLEISSDCTGSGIEISGTNTADITLSSGATIHNGTDIGGDDALVLTENHIQLVASGWGKISFGGMTDWGTGATGTVIDGVGWDWVTQTVGNVASDLPTCAAAASYNALTVTNNQTNGNSLFASWDELYLTGALTLTGSNNYASIYAVVELDSACTLPASSYVLAGVLSHITTVTGNTVNCPIVGFCADSNIHATATWTSHSSAFECKATTKDWDYGVYLDDYTTGIYFAETGAATEHLIDVVDAYLGLVIETGSYGDTATAVKLTSTNTRPASFLFDDGGVNIGGGADVRGVLSRIAVIAEQTGSSIAALRGQCKLIDNVDFDAYHLVGVEGYIELEGLNDITLETDGSAVACFRGRLEVNQNITHATANTYLTAFFADLKVASTKAIDQTSGVLAGLVVDASNVSGAAAAVDYWGHGVYIADNATDIGITIGATTTGIDIGACGTVGINIATGQVLGINIAGTTTAGILKAGVSDSSLISGGLGAPAIAASWVGIGIFGTLTGASGRLGNGGYPEDHGVNIVLKEDGEVQFMYAIQGRAYVIGDGASQDGVAQEMFGLYGRARVDNNGTVGYGANGQAIGVYGLCYLRTGGTSDVGGSGVLAGGRFSYKDQGATHTTAGVRCGIMAEVEEGTPECIMYLLAHSGAGTIANAIDINDSGNDVTNLLKLRQANGCGTEISSWYADTHQPDGSLQIDVANTTYWIPIYSTRHSS